MPPRCTVGRELAGLAADFRSRVSFSLADAFAAARTHSAIRTPHSTFLCAGDLEFKAVEKEIKINWLAAKG